MPRLINAEPAAAADAVGFAAVAAEPQAVRRQTAMIRWVFRAFGIVALLVAAVIVWLVLRPPAPVTVKVVNLSPKAIAWVQLRHQNGTEMLGEIPAGRSRIVKFRTKGETSYSLRVRFQDGKEIAGGGSYAEPGYSFTDSVTDSAVKNELGGLLY